MSKKLTVAVCGATGAVGREMLKTLHDRNFPASEVLAFASARSEGVKVPYGDTELTVHELKEDSFVYEVFPLCRSFRLRCRGQLRRLAHG